MRRNGAIAVARAAVAALAAACSSDTSGDTVRPGVWGSSQGSLTITDSTAHLLVAAGDCYGAYADIAGPLSPGAISRSGTFTQLMGAYPGFVQYPAQFTGTAGASQISVTVTLPTRGQQLGPFTLNYGVSTTWSPCLYP